jgi:hypothetical protein
MLYQKITEFAYHPGRVTGQIEHQHPESEFYTEYPGRSQIAFVFSVN